MFITQLFNLEQSVPYGFAEDELQKELFKAMEVLKVKEKNIFVFKIPVRKFLNTDKDILQSMIDLKNKIEPDIIFMPSLTDIHQDHTCVAQEDLGHSKQKQFFHTSFPGIT